MQIKATVDFQRKWCLKSQNGSTETISKKLNRRWRVVLISTREAELWLSPTLSPTENRPGISQWQFIWQSSTDAISDCFIFHHPSMIFYPTQPRPPIPLGFYCHYHHAHPWWGMRVSRNRIGEIKGQGRAQRTKLAPLSKTCKFMVAKRCFRSLLLDNVASPVLDPTDIHRKQRGAERWD